MLRSTSMLFWMVHLGAGDVHEPFGIISMLAVGVTFAVLRYGTGSLWLPISFQDAYDWAVIGLFGDPDTGFLSFFEMGITVPHWMVGPPGYVGVADVVFAFALVGGVYVFLYRRNGNIGPQPQAPAAPKAGLGGPRTPTPAGP